MEFGVKVICVFLFFIFISGCASIKEAAEGIAGVSTKAVEDGRGNALKKSFNYEYAECVKEVRKILSAAHCYIYADVPKKELIAVYISESDTTPVGIFFKKIDAGSTQVEVSSPSTFGKEFVFGKISAVLEKKITLTDLEVETNAREKEQNK